VVQNNTFFFIDKLRETHPELHDCGNRVEARCRICGDSKKNKTKKRLNFYKDTLKCFCFNCGFSGNIIYYLSLVCNKPFSQYKFSIYQELGKAGLAHRFNNLGHRQVQPLEIATVNDFDVVSKQFLSFSRDLPQVALDFIADRKFECAPYKQQGFEFRYDEQTGYLVFPWILKNRVYYYQKRNLQPGSNKPKYLFPKDLTRPLFGLDMINQDIPYIFLTESAFDSQWIKQCIGAGSILLSTFQWKLLQKLFPRHKFIFITDNVAVDTAASEIIFKLIKQYPQAQFFLFPQKHNVKDVNALACRDINEARKYQSLDFLLENSFSGAMTTLKLKLHHK
jgi:hypothetical protein